MKKEKKSQPNETSFENVSKTKSILYRIWTIFFWIAFAVTITIWTIDFIKVKKDDNPIFCIKKVEHQYDDGVTNECRGLGYHIYSYDRTSTGKARQFRPFFIKMDK